MTGGAGFIGSNLCRVLLSQQNTVVCLDNFATGRRENIRDFLSDVNFTLIEGDIRNYEDCRKAVDGCEIVLHQAALGSVPRSITDPMTTTDVNIGGFVKMLHAAVEANVRRFVYAASSSTYGDHKALPKQEHIIGKSLSPYAITKYVDELFAENFSAIYGIETIGLRYFNVFGRNQDPMGAYAAVIPKFVIQLLNHESPVINGDGSYSRDFTYIDNVIQANLLAASIPSHALKQQRERFFNSLEDGVKPVANQETIAEVFNVAYGENTSLVDLVHILKENLKEYDAEIANVDITFGPQRSGDIPHSLASIEKAKQILNYRPEFSVKEGLRLATKWYWENYK